MARPRKDQAEKLTCRLAPIRCTEDELVRIRSRAELAGLSVSAYVREMALHGEVTVRQARADFEVVQELRAWGRNLNQMMPRFHAFGKVPERLPRLLAKLEDLIDRLIDDAMRSR